LLPSINTFTVVVIFISFAVPGFATGIRLTRHCR
jgi:hypothetical protein